MEQSYSDSDISLSPSQILERLHTLRQLQLLQRGKLQKQCLNYQESPENSSSITEIVSHFSNSTSYNTFRSLLESADAISNEATPRSEVSGISKIVQEKDLIDGVSLLNLSQESELILISPVSTTSQLPAPSKNTVSDSNPQETLNEPKSFLDRKRISLDEMPILSPKKDFEALILEKLNTEKKNPTGKTPQKKESNATTGKKAFLRRGEGMSRFGIGKKNLVIQNTNSLPWKKNSKQKQLKVQTPPKENVNIQIVITEPREPTNQLSKNDTDKNHSTEISKAVNIKRPPSQPNKFDSEITMDSSNCELHAKVKQPDIKSKINELKNIVKQKHPLIANKGKSWAAVLTKEQDDFLRQLKQSDYYKNFASPAKSTVSDISRDDISHEREAAEQNMFDLLERKATHESFNLENSFINRFIRNHSLECSGESTPLVMQRCLSNNPNLMHIFPELNLKRNQTLQSEAETCESECSDCCNDASSSASSCCSCKTVEHTNMSENKKSNKRESKTKSNSSNENKRKEDVKQVDNSNDAVTENDIIKANMEEMNAKLIATSELLKDRLRELEDEIETFRKENTNLSKMREEMDLERQKFYEEKQTFEQKFNEEKILSEYYLADEKEKLAKQKQMYDRYVREMRGRLNKKDKDEVVNLKKEISDLKEDIRLKDAKSTSLIARLRNQIKIMEKENKTLQDELEKLKKQNRRIQHSNEISRRLTNIKYLEEINKKLSNMAAKDAQPDIDVDRDVKYKAFEIERQCRGRTVPNAPKTRLRGRAKSVPNLKVTSRYAKYFSQRDAASEIEKNNTMYIEHMDTQSNRGDDDKENLSDCASMQDEESLIKNTDNNLERLYAERFQSVSPRSSRSSLTDTSSNIDKNNSKYHYDNFFMRKSNGSKSPVRNSTSPYLRTSTTSNLNTSKSPVSVKSHRSSQKSPTYDSTICKSAEPNLSDHSNYGRKSPISHKTNSRTDINQNKYLGPGIVLSPEPTISKSSLTKTSLNPTEIRKPDGSRELRFPNGNVKYISADGKYTKFVYYNGDIKENFYSEGRIKYYYAENKTFHTTHADGLEVLEFADGQVEKRYKDGSTEIRLPNGSVRYYDPKNDHVREEWRFPDGAALTVSANGEQRIVFSNGQVEVHAKDHKRREFPDGTVKLVYNDGTAETRYASGRVRIKDKHGNLIMDSAPG